MMRPLYLPTIATASQDVWNMRLKMKKLLFEAESSTIDTIQGICNATAEYLLPRGAIELVPLDESPAGFLPVASELATEILKVEEHPLAVLARRWRLSLSMGCSKRFVEKHSTVLHAYPTTSCINPFQGKSYARCIGWEGCSWSHRQHCWRIIP
jgi:hypothetical protein